MLFLSEKFLIIYFEGSNNKSVLKHLLLINLKKN